MPIIYKVDFIFTTISSNYYWRKFSKSTYSCPEVLDNNHYLGLEINSTSLFCIFLSVYFFLKLLHSPYA